MTDHNQDTITFRAATRAVATSFCVLVASIAACTSNTNYQKRVLAETGADPIAVNCLYGDTSAVDCLSAVLAKR